MLSNHKLPSCQKASHHSLHIAHLYPPFSFECPKPNTRPIKQYEVVYMPFPMWTPNQSKEPCMKLAELQSIIQDQNSA